MKRTLERFWQWCVGRPGLTLIENLWLIFSMPFTIINNTASWLTFSRILATPVLVFLVSLNTPWAHWAAIVLFVAAGITDYLDGYYARKMGLVSNFGKFMDPVADKVLVSGILVSLLWLNRIDQWVLFLILSRDTIIAGVRSIAAADQMVIDAKPSGKWKTALQMGTIPFLLIPGAPLLHQIGYYAMWISVILSLTSGFEYIRDYVAHLRQTSQHTQLPPGPPTK